MKGAFQIRVRNSRNSYSFELRRNITVLRGESGRGKTTLFEMIHEYNRFGKNSGVTVSCDRDLIAVVGDEWETVIKNHPGAVIVVDEDSQFIRSKDFARVLRGSDNYFLLITRNYLAELPISVDEIYELWGAKNKKYKRIYQEIDRMFDREDIPGDWCTSHGIMDPEWGKKSDDPMRLADFLRKMREFLSIMRNKARIDRGNIVQYRKKW